MGAMGVKRCNREAWPDIWQIRRTWYLPKTAVLAHVLAGQHNAAGDSVMISPALVTITASGSPTGMVVLPDPQASRAQRVFLGTRRSLTSVMFNDILLEEGTGELKAQGFLRT
jgi:hypothetical protein